MNRKLHHKELTICEHVVITKEHITKLYILLYSGKVWQINSFRAFGKRKFGELIDQPIRY